MAKLNILTFPDPRLRKVAVPVTKFDKSLKNFVSDMLETMYQENGIGLAASQVDFHERIIVIDISDDRNDPKVFINPEFKVLDDKSLLSFNEGCLSVPGVTEEIVRPDSIYLTWQDVNGEHHADEPSGLLTVCIQHEIDHLEGKLMVDYLSPLKRDRIRKKASK
ncbi:peptide deformylase [Gammaproteobacteria bacterium]|jgi:peptide deformylase|nr:peptide deformylase [Rhodobacterales bacterium]MDA9175421.1 peptide deformylase [Gammaproteobacteria bacterium]MDA9834386.1 peptide deformylase [Gammaproteobacteria bacterium]MDA9917205.1 peptide deformylase [Gammaproteobacteria bacterium]MDA9979570.1 peptide deformylase [Gammaproteobacteria bacterium]